MLQGVPEGGIARALVWVVAGLAAAFALVVLVSPELLRADPRYLTGLFGLVSVAAVPGLVLLVVAAIRRRRVDADDPSAPPDTTGGSSNGLPGAGAPGHDRGSGS